MSNSLDTTQHVPFVATLQQVSRLNHAFEAITYDEFCAVLLVTIGARHDYAQGCWPAFRQGPIGYCASRGPIVQGEALFALALAKMNHADATGRDINCCGEGQCHRASSRCATCGDVERTCHRVDTCKWHGPVSDAKIREAVLGNVGGLGVKHGTRLEHLAGSLAREFGSHVDYIGARGADALAALMGTGEVMTHTLYGEGWLMRPLATLKQGEHSAECPVTVEYWLTEPAECDPRVCAYVPIAKVIDEYDDDDGSGGGYD